MHAVEINFLAMSMLKSRYKISQRWSNGILFVLLGGEHKHRPTIGAVNFSDLTSHAYFQKFEKHLINVLESCVQRLRFPSGNSEIHPTHDNTRNYLGHGINNILLYIATNQSLSPIFQGNRNTINFCMMQTHLSPIFFEEGHLYTG